MTKQLNSNPVANPNVPENYRDSNHRVDSPTGGTKNDAAKPDMNLLHQGCPLALREAALVMSMGAKKYGKYNWKEVEPERYLSAMYRHLNAYHLNSTSIDEDSGQSHLSHVLCNILFLTELDREKQTTSNTI